MRISASVSILAVLMAAPVAAQEADAPDDAEAGAENDGAIMVTASRSGTELAELPISASVVDEEELAEQLAYSTNVMRALEYAVPGLAPQREGRSNCSPNIRGRATSILVNGIPVNEELRESTCNQMYQLSPFALERIEVLRGGTALYGAGSPGGIINFITRRAEGERLEIDAVAQTSFNSSDADDTFVTDLYAGAGQSFAGWDYYAGIAYTDAGADRNPDGEFTAGRVFDSLALNGSLGADLAGGEARLTATWYRENPGREYWVPFPDYEVDEEGHPIAVPAEPHPLADEAVLRSTTVALSYAHPQVLGHELSVSGYYQNQFYAQRDNLFACCLTVTDSEHDRLGFRSTLVKRAQLGGIGLTGSYGFDFTRNRYYRPDFDNETAATIIGFTSPEVFLNTYAVFGQAELDFGRVSLTGGARHEWYRGKVGTDGYAGNEALDGAAPPGAFGHSSLTLLNLGAVVDLTDAVQLYGGFSQGAELSELGRAARNIEDPGLVTPEPATSDQFELGLRGQTGPLDFGVAGFYSTSDKAALLQRDPDCTDDLGCFLIPFRVAQRFYGFEGHADLRATEQLDLSAVVTWQRGKVYDEELDRYVRYSTDVVAPFRATGSADYRPFEGFGMTLQGTYYGGSDYLTPDGQIMTDAVFLMDASVRYAVGPGEVYAAASNLFDERYINVSLQPWGSLPGDYFHTLAQGRRVTLGYRARF